MLKTLALCLLAATLLTALPTASADDGDPPTGSPEWLESCVRYYPGQVPPVMVDYQECV